MWKRDEAVKTDRRPAQRRPRPRWRTCSRQPRCHRSREIRRQIERDVVNIGKSVVIRGELNGSEDLTIEGPGRRQDRAEGSRADDRAPTAKIKAQVFAKSVIVLRRSERQRHGVRKGRHPRRRIGRRRHRVAARGDRRRRALPRQRRHAAQGMRSRAPRPQQQEGSRPAVGDAGAAAAVAGGRAPTQPSGASVALVAGADRGSQTRAHPG